MRDRPTSSVLPTLVGFLLIGILPAAGTVRGQSLPASYDLRSIATLSGTVAWVSAIQNQGTAEDCWTFASATAMDSNLLMQGLLATGSVAPAPEVSSWHLSTANGNPNQIDPAKAFTSASNWGGFEYMALGYVTRGAGQWTIPGNHDPSQEVTLFGGGPVSNAADPANVFPASISNYNGDDALFTPNPITPLLPPVNQPTAWRVTNVTILDQGFSNNVDLPSPSGTVTIGSGGNAVDYLTYSFTLGAADPQVQAVKAAILSSGAVTTSMNSQGNFIAVSNQGVGPALNTIEYRNPYAAPGNSDHEVTIIGWDDTKQITAGGATTTGAWLVQNSWGTSFYTNTPVDYSDGTFWAAYDDAVIGRSGVASFQLASMEGWSQTVLQNELGPMAYADNFDVVAGAASDKPGWVGSPTGMATVDASSVMSILTPDTSGVLAGLGMATQVGGIDVLASIYDWNATTQTFGTLLGQSTFTDESIGFFLGAIDPITLLGGNSYAVVLDYSKNGSPYASAAGVTIGGSGLNGYLHVGAGLSYYQPLGTNQWVDMNTLDFTSSSTDDAQGGVLFLKGYLSSVPELDPSGLAGAVTAALGALALVESRRRSR